MERNVEKLLEEREELYLKVLLLTENDTATSDDYRSLHEKIDELNSQISLYK